MTDWKLPHLASMLHLGQGQAWDTEQVTQPSGGDVGAAGAGHHAGPSSPMIPSHPHPNPLCDTEGVTPES